MAYVRFLEGVKEREIELFKVWMAKVHESDKQLADRAAEVAKRAKKLADEEKARKTRDPEAVAAEMMRAMGLPEVPTQPKAAGSKKRKAAGSSLSKKAQSDKTPSLTNPNAVGALRMRDEKPSATREEPSASSSADYDETERLANLEAAKAENAKHNLELAEGQRMLQDRRAKGKEDGAMARAALLKRQETWLERAFNASLVAFDPSKQVSLSELNLKPDFDRVCGILRTAGCYIDTNIHNNEKFVARWVGSDGKNHMAWGGGSTSWCAT
jgi:hypothetical protein